jgi:four helix bundle protein
MAGVRDHTELTVWQLGDALRTRVEDVVSRPAFRAPAWLRRQLHEAAESVCPNIAEGFSRYHPRENARFVRIAKGSLSETIGHLERARALGLIEEDETAEITTLARRARGAATHYIRYLESATAPNVPRTAPRRRPPPTR